MTTTTVHPILPAVERTLALAAEYLDVEGWQRHSYRVSDAVEEAAQSRYHAAVALRVLAFAGVDVAWDDLICASPNQAATAVRTTMIPDLKVLYGQNPDAVLGLIKAASMTTPEQLNGLANVTTPRCFHALQKASAYAEHVGLASILEDIAGDIAYCIPKPAASRKAIGVRMSALLAFDAAAASIVLAHLQEAGACALSLDEFAALAEPLYTMLKL